MMRLLRKIRPLGGAVLAASFLLSPLTALAANAGTNGTAVGLVANVFSQGVAYLVDALIELFGKLSLLLIDGLLAVASYNGYSTNAVIGTGWVLVRDVSNLFFVALILVISIGTIVNPGKFGGAAKVFRVLLFAVFVNFSRTICGIFIDVSQIIMLTFVNGFAQAAGGNFAEALGVQKVITISANGTTPITAASTLGAAILALIIFIVINVIVGIMIVALVVRMITIWGLVVLSPLAFALGSYAGTKGRYDEWWKMFSKELTAGPIVAFFLWLSLLTIQTTSNTDITGQDLLKGRTPSTAITCGDMEFCQEQNVLRFIIAAAMLLQGLKFAQDFSGLGGDLAKKARGKMDDYGKKAIAYMNAKSIGATKAVGSGALRVTGVTAGANLVADKYTSFRQNRAKDLGNSRLGRMPLIGGLVRSAAGNTLAQTAKRDEEELKKAQESMKSYTPEMRAAVLNSRVSTKAEKKAVAFGMIKDKAFKNAKPDSADAAERARAETYKKAFSELQSMGGKDAEDVVKDIKESRPDLESGFDPARTAAGLDRDKFLKLNFDAISADNRRDIIRNLPRDIYDEAYKKANGSQKKYMRDARLPENATGAQFDQMLSEGVVDLADLSEAQLSGQTPAGARLNVEIPEKVLVNGTDAQMSQLTRNSLAKDIGREIAAALRNQVDFTRGATRGMDAGNTRMSDENLRRAEAAAVLGHDIGDLYKIRDDGTFAEPTGLAEKSFRESLHSSPKRLQFIMNLGSRQMQGGAGDAVYEEVTNADLKKIASLASSPKEVGTLRELVRTIHQKADAMANDASLSATVRTRAAVRRNEIAGNPELSRLV